MWSNNKNNVLWIIPFILVISTDLYATDDQLVRAPRTSFGMAISHLVGNEVVCWVGENILSIDYTKPAPKEEPNLADEIMKLSRDEQNRLWTLYQEQKTIPAIPTAPPAPPQNNRLAQAGILAAIMKGPNLKSAELRGGNKIQENQDQEDSLIKELQAMLDKRRKAAKEDEEEEQPSNWDEDTSQ